jgi:RNA 2',3'-cyclic 3'-phosphodiesterase
VRLFVAAYPSQPALDELDDAVAGLTISTARRDGLNTRLTDRALWHVTVAFLGEVAEAKAAEAGRAVGRATESARPLQMRLAGGGLFGRGRFTVLWAGLSGDLQRLGLLADAVRRELKVSRLPFDGKKFNPHLTLARPGERLTGRELAADVEVLSAYRGPQWTLSELHLMASHLGPHPTHERLSTARLGG